jgi:hypothetical protein
MLKFLHCTVSLNSANLGSHGSTHYTTGFDGHRISAKHPQPQTVNEFSRRLLDIIVYEKGCRIGATFS